MGPIPQGGTVAVTGSAGFIGGWIVQQLLAKGYRVRACVRDADDLTELTTKCNSSKHLIFAFLYCMVFLKYDLVPRVFLFIN